MDKLNRNVFESELRYIHGPALYAAQGHSAETIARVTSLDRATLMNDMAARINYQSGQAIKDILNRHGP